MEFEKLRLEGNALMETDPAGALAKYKKAAEVGDGLERAQALANAAAAELRLGRFGEAEGTATKALEIRVSVTALYRRAVARRMLKAYEEAYDDLVAAMAIEPLPVLREEISALRRAATSDDDEVDRLDALVKKHGLDLEDGDRTSAGDVARACTEPFYAGRGPRNGIEAYAGGEEIKYFGPAGVQLVDGVMVKQEGPTVMDVVIRDESYYYGTLVFRLAFAERYPSAPPRVRCESIVQHAMFSDPHARRATLEFYDKLLEKKPISVANTVATIREVLAGGDSNEWARYARKHKERQLIIDAFKKHHHAAPELYEEGSLLEAAVWGALEPAVRDALGSGDAASCCEKVTDGVWSLDLFTPTFSKRLIDEIDCFYASGLPAQRPNSMNNYGVIVNDVGLENFVTTLQRLVLEPIAARLFDRWQFDSHHAFIVKYRSDEDSHLDIHTDDSDVTFNVCLGRDFEGCGLVFCGTIGKPDHRSHKITFHHKVGRCVVHLGSRRHGADHITKGERLNLVVWNHSLAYRDSVAATAHNRDYSVEQGPPDPRCVSYTHDRDYGRFKDYPKDRAHFRGRGWCPPPGAEYPNFKPDDDE